MSPITFTCKESLTLSPEEIAARILDVASWPSFTGYGFIPGVRMAQFEVRTPEIVGSRILVTNTDESSHVEEIVEWRPQRLCLRMQEFSPPLSRLAKCFDETWEFQRRAASTTVVRRFALYPTSILFRPILWLISRFLRRAVICQLRQMRFLAPSETPIGGGVSTPPTTLASVPGTDSVTVQASPENGDKSGSARPVENPKRR